jgi:hypothetical protein
MNEPRSITWLDRTTAKVASAVALPVCAALTATGLRKTPDPWRRTLGVGLRSEGSKFVLSAFGLHVPPGPEPFVDLAGVSEFETNLLIAFAKFLDDEPDARFALSRSPHCDERVRTDHVDVALGQFNPNGKLAHLTFWLDPRKAVSVDRKSAKDIEVAVVRAYNHTHAQPEIARGEHVLEHLEGTGEHGERIMSSVLVSVEGDPDTFFTGDRFAAPDFRLRRSLPLGFMSLVVRRVGRHEIDCWLQLHHVAADGVPMQELMTRLQRAWPPETPFVFPNESLPRVQQASMPGERELWQAHDFLDFQSLLEIRKTLNNAPLAAVFLWQLAKQPEFAGVRFALAIDVPAATGVERSVDLVSLRPADFGDRFDEFRKSFRSIVEAGRERRSTTYLAMRQIAQLPAKLAHEMVRTHPDLSAQTFGTVGVTILKDANVFLAPMSDIGFDGGFLALGNVALPTNRGARVGCVSVKGTAEQVNQYLAVLRRMLAGSASGISEYSFIRSFGGRTRCAKVGVRVTRQADQHGVIQSIDNNVSREAGEVNMKSEPSWVTAAMYGATEAVEIASRSGTRKEHYFIEIVKVVGTLLDTTDDAVRCAATIATWRNILPGSSDLTVEFDEDSNEWKIKFPPTQR